MREIKAVASRPPRTSNSRWVDRPRGGHCVFVSDRLARSHISSGRPTAGQRRRKAAPTELAWCGAHGPGTDLHSSFLGRSALASSNDKCGCGQGSVARCYRVSSWKLDRPGTPSLPRFPNPLLPFFDGQVEPAPETCFSSSVLSSRIVFSYRKASRSAHLIADLQVKQSRPNRVNAKLMLT